MISHAPSATIIKLLCAPTHLYDWHAGWILGRRFLRLTPPRNRQLPEPEASTVLAAHERRNRLITPIVRRVLSWLVGWRYDGTPTARRRLVAELPVIGLRPADRP
jgi:hypothetical protein